MTTLGVGAVLWNDAVSFSNNQYEINETPHFPLLMASVGIILSSDKKGVSIAREISSEGSIRGVMFIPRDMVQKEIIYEKEFIKHIGGTLGINTGEPTPKKKKKD